MRMLISVLAWFFMSSSTPYISKGLTNPDTRYSIEVNPNMSSSVPILRSKNGRKGIEFTYAIWMFVDNLKNTESVSGDNYSAVFNKGDMDYIDANGLSRIAGPGLYISKNKNKLKIRMNVFDSDPLYNAAVEKTQTSLWNDIIINDIPLKKWFNVMIRCEGNMLDVLINGMIVKRHKLTGVPRQNYNKILLTPDAPFSGYVSDLRYWNYSLGTNEIYSLISKGANTKNLATEQSIDGTLPRYFATSWFLKN